MTIVRIEINNEINEASFESYRAAVKHFNAVVKELAPCEKRKHYVEDHEPIKTNTVCLMRGRFVEEYVEF